MSKESKNFKEITKIYEQLTEKLENIDENTNLSKLLEELKEMQKDLDIKK